MPCQMQGKVYDGHMTQPGRLSSCDHCGRTIHLTVDAGWMHVVPLPLDRPVGHRAEPDDSRIDGPDHSDICDGDCDDCVNERALDDDHEMSRER